MWNRVINFRTKWNYSERIDVCVRPIIVILRESERKKNEMGYMQTWFYDKVGRQRMKGGRG